nr:MAG TPA: hypothetical protein [Caudoviricetes sp.]
MSRAKGLFYIRFPLLLSCRRILKDHEGCIG